MLKQRIVTAVLLLAMLSFALFNQSPLPFVLVASGLISAAAWEWGRMNQCGPVASYAAGLLCCLACMGAWYGNCVNASHKTLWLVGGTAWVLLGSWLLSAGAKAWTATPRWLRALGGLLALWMAWLAILQARQIGLNFLFSAMTLVWVADIGAYFAGRWLGGRWFARKLAPTISPGKTWEGVVGGLFAVFLLAFIWLLVELHAEADSVSVYRHLWNGGPFVLMLGIVFLTAMSVVGDLVESLFKRAAGFKDSSQLLPGHGGVLDRIDALLPTLPLAMMLVAVGNA